MRKLLLIGLYLLCLCGCGNKGEETYTYCEYLSDDNNFKSYINIYTDNKKEYILKIVYNSSIVYNSISEAIDAETNENNLCKDDEEVVECNISRENKTVFSNTTIIPKNNSSYKQQIEKIEKTVFKCEEKRH